MSDASDTTGDQPEPAPPQGPPPTPPATPEAAPPTAAPPTAAPPTAAPPTAAPPAAAPPAAAPPTPSATPAASPTVKRHPIRGAFWGLLMGIGIALALIGFAVIAAGTLTPYVVAACGVVVGVLWGFFAPAKGPKGPAPA